MQFECSVWSLFRPMKLLLLISLSGLISCKCDNMCNQGNSSSSSSANSSSGSGGGTTPNPNSFYLNCADLDPDKVYLLGTLRTGFGGFDALLDPEDPTKFCVGFPDGTASHTITTSGELIYIHHGNNATFAGGQARKFVQDTLSQSDIGWGYPVSPQNNDVPLLTAAERRLFVRHNSETALDDIYYPSKPSSVELSIYLNIDTTPYYSLSSKELLSSIMLIGVSPDGSLLVSDSEVGIVLVNPDKSEAVITPPIPGSYNFWSGESKFFVDPVSGHQSAWILVRYNASSEHRFGRWTLDLETREIKDDGSFSATPNGGNELSSKFNGKGELIQIVLSNSVYSVVKVPLLSTTESSSVIYSDASDTDNRAWEQRPSPFVYVEDGELVTGQ